MKATCLILSLVCLLSFRGNTQSLQTYFQIAAENNPGLQAKYKSFEAALQKIPQATGLEDPNLSFSYLISPGQSVVESERMVISLSQMFPWFGTLKLRGDVASLLAEAKYQEFLDARNLLYSEVSAAYFPLLELHELIHIEKENLEILSTYKSLANSRFENGAGSLSDILRVEIMMTSSKTNLKVLEQKIQSSNAWLNSLLARAYDTPVEVTERLTTPRVPSLISFDSIAQNPLLESMDLKIKASELEQQLADKQGRPNLGVGIDYMIMDKNMDMGMNGEGSRNMWMPMVSMSIPIFRGKYEGAKKEAQFRAESYQEEQKNISNQLHGFYHKYETEMKVQLNLISSYEEQIKTSEQTLELLYQDYANSGEDYEEVLRLQQQILEFQKQKLQAAVSYYLAEAQLNYLTAKTY